MYTYTHLYLLVDLQKELETRTCTISQTAFRVQRKLRGR